ncbi:MAG TPA: DUF1343 domain-containing protein [Candidatus Hydrogenedentes bacterium]|nr:DUF1343 domain-containing protein [Candidatus Hydrogenedentota bacterium]
MRKELGAALAEGLERGSGPGGVAYIGDRDTTFFHGVCGLRQREPQEEPAEKDTLYDLASLTKVLATTTAVLLLRDDGAVDLNEPVAAHVPLPGLSRFTTRHLLTHTAGLPSGMPLYAHATTLDEMLQRISEAALENEPGTARRYSDAGFIILGKLVELAGRDSLDGFCRRRVFGPLGMSHTAFRPPAEWVGRCAATERCPWRGRIMVGEVHDENAYAIGGVAGHAGLFSTAKDLARFCRALLRGEIVCEPTLREMTQLNQVPRYPWQGLGWLVDPWGTGETGFLPSRTAFGHAGWTGTSVWLDRETGLFAILLSNTCHPSRSNRDNGALRRAFYGGVASAFYPQTTATHVGLDRLVLDQFEPVHARRIGLLTNHAALDQFGRHILETLRLGADVTPEFLYSPEHGIRGSIEAGAAVASERGPVPVVSLYGDHHEPPRDQLERIDLFVIDLPDIGSRYYTYMATMRRCLAACGRAGKPVLVLDRPNPIGGTILEGPIASNTSSLVCCAPIPVRHGMTMGELALLFRERVIPPPRPRLAIAQLDNWNPERLFDECALPWMPPSPNIPTPETALLYVGMCLLEGTNLNEGRGTDTPFYLAGAPWLDPEAVLNRFRNEDAPGCTLEPCKYTPHAIPGKAPAPRYRDVPCQGIRLSVKTRRSVRAFRTAVAMLIAIRRAHPEAFEFRPFFDTLAGSTDLRTRIEQGASARSIVRESERSLPVFDTSRPRLYGT